MTASRLAPRINDLSSNEFTPLPGAVIADNNGLDGFSGARSLKPIAPPRFMAASGMAFEVTLHTLRMKSTDGDFYNVVLELTRNGKTSTLRAAVAHAETGKTVASFDAPAGVLDTMDTKGHLAFAAKDGAVAFDLTATLAPTTMVQGRSDKLRSAVEKSLAAVPAEQVDAARAKLALELSVTDYPLATHTGTMTVKVDGKALKLTANGAPSTICHQYGSKPASAVLVASVPKSGAARVMAVVAKAGGQSFGYVIRADAAGTTKVALLTSDAFAAGGLLGNIAEVKSDGLFGSVTLNDYRVLNTLGLSEPETFLHAVVR